MGQTISLPELSPWQSRVYYDKHRHHLLFGGRRKGKSKVLQFKSFRVAATGGLVLWTSGDSDLAEIGWKELTEWVSQFSERYAPAGKGIVTLNGGGMIKRTSAAKATSGRGPTPNLVVVDECQTVPVEFIMRVRPSVIVNGGGLLLAGTPPDNNQQLKNAKWIREMIEFPERYPDWLIDVAPTTVDDIAFMLRANNPEAKLWSDSELRLRAKRELDNLRLEMGETNYRREIEAKWEIRTEGRVLDQFNSNNYSERFDFDPSEGDVYWFMDRGEGSAYTVCLWAQVQLSRPGLIVFGERFTIKIVDEGDFVEECLKQGAELGWPTPRKAVYDVRAPRFRRALLENGIMPFACNRFVDEGVQLLNAGFGKGWINFHTRCTHLEGEMRTWLLKSNGDPSDDHRDGADALRYGYEYLIDHYGKHWRSVVTDGSAPRREAPKTVFTFSWV